jgi:hypothetical protein
MTEITIVVSPAFDRRGKRRNGRFDVHLQGNDGVICEATQQPLLDASRVLLRRGVDPTTTICKVRVDKPTIVTMRAAIGVAAQYDVMGEKFVRRKPATGAMQGSGIENAQSAAAAGPCLEHSCPRLGYGLSETAGSEPAGIANHITSSSEGK